MKIQNNYDVNFKANRILTAKLGNKDMVNVYKLTTSKEDIYSAQHIYDVCSKAKTLTSNIQKVKTFFASFLTNINLNKQDPKYKIPTYYIGQAHNKNLCFGYKLNNNMDNFVLFENYIKPNDQISTITLARSVADEIVKQPPKSLISNSLIIDNKTLLKQKDLNKFINITKSPKATLKFEEKNDKVDLDKILFNR